MWDKKEENTPKLNNEPIYATPPVIVMVDGEYEIGLEVEEQEDENT